ncbi:MAG: class I SAM-dependent methyltransferase family protein [Candidatus Thorarchaeota archaeon]|nr:MAG: class I SAM-dependent methyltransferase family protein [Candidatus Thorarchaeota archaeon]
MSKNHARTCVERMRYRDYLQAKLNVPLSEGTKLPSGFQMVGHVALVHLDHRFWQYAEQVGELTIEYNRRIRSVAARCGPTKGVTRKPAYRLVAGDPDTVTTLTEGGIKFSLDPLLVTFSRGNRQERLRVSSVVRQGEVVVDMFACVGQFALPVAKAKSSQVFAIEIDPVAYGFLLQNVRLNNLDNKLVPILGDCREVHPVGVADRVIMGYLHDTFMFLPAAFETLSKAGGMIHMHVATPMKNIASLKEMIASEAAERGFRANIVVRRVKTYSPGVEHIAFDIHAAPN